MASREERASSDGKPYTGGSNGSYRGYKLGLFDGGIRVPAILSAPGFVEAGAVWDRPMASMDLMPTILSMADPAGTPPAGLDGQTILPVLRGEKPPHEYLYWSFNNQRAVRSSDWKLILNPPSFPGEEVDARVWLSNLESDPSERSNLATKEAKRVADLADRVRRWEREMNLPSR